MLRGFSWKHGINYFPDQNGPVRHHISTFTRSRICLRSQPTCLNLDNHRQASLAFSVTPLATYVSAGILTSFPLTTPFGLALGADSPCADERCAGTLSLSARRIFTPFIVTHVSILTSDTSSAPHDTPSAAYRTLLYRSRNQDSVNPQLRYVVLDPLHLPRRLTRPVSNYAFFKGWLLLSQPPGCLCLPTTFPT